MQGIFLPFSAFTFSFVRSLLRSFSSIIHFFLDVEFLPRFSRNVQLDTLTAFPTTVEQQSSLYMSLSSRFWYRDVIQAHHDNTQRPEKQNLPLRHSQPASPHSPHLSSWMLAPIMHNLQIKPTHLHPPLREPAIKLRPHPVGVHVRRPRRHAVCPGHVVLWSCGHFWVGEEDVGGGVEPGGCVERGRVGGGVQGGDRG